MQAKTEKKTIRVGFTFTSEFVTILEDFLGVYNKGKIGKNRTNKTEFVENTILEKIKSLNPAPTCV